MNRQRDGIGAAVGTDGKRALGWTAKPEAGRKVMEVAWSGAVWVSAAASYLTGQGMTDYPSLAHDG